MPATRIKCGGCGNEGEMEIIGQEPAGGLGMMFRYLGNHEFTGNIYFLCPHCHREVVVNPMEVSNARLINAKAYLPPYASAEISRISGVSKKRSLLHTNKP